MGISSIAAAQQLLMSVLGTNLPTLPFSYSISLTLSLAPPQVLLNVLKIFVATTLTAASLGVCLLAICTNVCFVLLTVFITPFNLFGRVYLWFCGAIAWLTVA